MIHPWGFHERPEDVADHSHCPGCAMEKTLRLIPEAYRHGMVECVMCGYAATIDRKPEGYALCYDVTMFRRELD